MRNNEESERRRKSKEEATTDIKSREKKIERAKRKEELEETGVKGKGKRGGDQCIGRRRLRYTDGNGKCVNELVEISKRCPGGIFPIPILLCHHTPRRLIIKYNSELIKSRQQLSNDTVKSFKLADLGKR